LSLEEHFAPTFAAALALREKQIQQSYRPIIGVHKWFARRPGTVFRNLLLAEFNSSEPLDTSYWRAHALRGVLADPFMGGGTPIYEANRLGFSVVGTDINAMAYWIVRQSLAPLDLAAFTSAADAIASDVEQQVGDLYRTRCSQCGQSATVKYFLWVKVEVCPFCGTENDLFPGYLLAEASRHPKHVVVCGACGALNEYDCQPTHVAPETCHSCGNMVQIEGPARKQHVRCKACNKEYAYPARKPEHPPRHRMWALEYHCQTCKATQVGRFFKPPDAEDVSHFERARALLERTADLPIPEDEIPAGDETDRLHRWGYVRYREMFNERQLLGLGLLLCRIQAVADTETRHALLTVFSDFLRYQNMLCRYDTYALKCQDIFSVHGFPVGLIQCENNLLGVPRVGSGSFRHFVEKYRRAKRYCVAPFETRQDNGRKKTVFIRGERIQARFVDVFPSGHDRQAYLLAAPATEMPLPAASLDGVFTDPPYFDNVQYAELMDFCFAWLRLGLRDELAEFQGSTTRTDGELTGNVTLGRGLDHFTAGLSAVFCHYAAALKPDAPFVFTYHHNDPSAYVPLVVAILDAGMNCTATLPAVAEMSASLHIAKTSSSVLDSVFVCRLGSAPHTSTRIETILVEDGKAMRAAGIRLTEGDVRCLAAGHIARVAVNQLSTTWDSGEPLSKRMTRAMRCLTDLTNEFQIGTLISEALQASMEGRKPEGEHYAATLWG
jgi:adenine-specific DNA methylase